jgi:hypothetical protein
MKKQFKLLFFIFIISRLNSVDFIKIGFPYIYYFEFQTSGSDFKNFSWLLYNLLYDIFISIASSALFVAIFKVVLRKKKSS